MEIININNNLIITIVLTGIIGPILEEYLFRGIAYNKLKEISSKLTSKILVSLVFALMHPNVFQAVYAFILSYILCEIYDKTKNIKSLIIIHMIGNLAVIAYRYVVLFIPNLGLISILIVLILGGIFSLKKIINHED